MTMLLGCFQLMVSAAGDSQPKAVVDLARRIAGEKDAAKFEFVFETTASVEEPERFTIGST